MGEVGDAFFVEGDVGVGVVHHTGGLGGGAGGEVVAEAEGVAGLMRGELADAGEDHLEHGVFCGILDGFADGVGGEEGFGDEVVLAAAEGAECDVAFDDFAGARVGDGGAVAPAAGVAVYPLDDVETDVHGVGVGREDVDAEGSGGPAGGLEGLVPPACAFKEGGADGLGGAAVDVVLDGGDGGAGGLAGGIALDEAVTDDELLVECGTEGGGVVAVGGGEVASAGIKAAGGEAGVRKLDEGLVLAEGEGVGVGGDVADELASWGAVGGEGEEGFHLGVAGEGFGGVERDGGAGGVELVGALLDGGQALDDSVGVAEEEVGGVDEDGGGVFGLYLEAPQDGDREGLADGELLGSVGGGGAEGLVRLDQEDLGSGALEADDGAFGGLATVEAEVVGAGAVGEGVSVEEVGIEARDFEVELAGFGVPVEGEEAGGVGHAGGAGGDGGEGGRGFVGRLRWREECEGEERKCAEVHIDLFITREREGVRRYWFE